MYRFSRLGIDSAGQDVVHATTSPQWLAGWPSHPVRGGPSPCDPLWTRLGPNMYENGRSSVQHRWKGLISLWSILQTACVDQLATVIFGCLNISSSSCWSAVTHTYWCFGKWICVVMSPMSVSVFFSCNVTQGNKIFFIVISFIYVTQDLEHKQNTIITWHG